MVDKLSGSQGHRAPHRAERRWPWGQRETRQRLSCKSLSALSVPIAISDLSNQTLTLSTVEFPGMSDDLARKFGVAEYEICHSVDVQNAFDAMIRTNYCACVQQPGPETWRPVELEM